LSDEIAQTGSTDLLGKGGKKVFIPRKDTGRGKSYHGSLFPGKEKGDARGSFITTAITYKLRLIGSRLVSAWREVKCRNGVRKSPTPIRNTE